MMMVATTAHVYIEIFGADKTIGRREVKGCDSGEVRTPADSRLSVLETDPLDHSGTLSGQTTMFVEAGEQYGTGWIYRLYIIREIRYTKVILNDILVSGGSPAHMAFYQANASLFCSSHARNTTLHKR